MGSEGLAPRRRGVRAGWLGGRPPASAGLDSEIRADQACYAESSSCDAARSKIMYSTVAVDVERTSNVSRVDTTRTVADVSRGRTPAHASGGIRRSAGVERHCRNDQSRVDPREARDGSLDVQGAGEVL